MGKSDNHPWGKKLSMHTSCNGCTERHKACWADCEKYKADREKHSAMRDERQKDIDSRKPLIERKYINKRGRRATGRYGKKTDYE